MREVGYGCYWGRDKLRDDKQLSRNVEQVRARQDSSHTWVCRLLMIGSVNGHIVNGPVQICPEF